MARVWFLLLLSLMSCTIFVSSMVINKRNSNINSLGTDEFVDDESRTTTSTSPPLPDCHRDTPCSWDVYRPFVRNVEYRVKNTQCKCREGTICSFAREDLSMSAYVNKCLPIPTNLPISSSGTGSTT